MSLIPKGNKIYSILYSKCPKCNEGDVFISANPYNLKMMAAMHKKCMVCGLYTEPEPGFFWGAMFVSYALTVGLGFIVAGTMHLMGYELWLALVVIVMLLIVLSPYTFRLARMIWFNFFYRFDKNAISNRVNQT